MDDRLLAILERQIQANEKLANEISENRHETSKLKNEIITLNKSLNNGVLGGLCKKVDKTFWAVAVLLVPLLALLAKTCL